MLSSTTRVVFILSLLLRLSVLKVNGESVFIDGRYIDYEFGHAHTCSYDMPANITMAQSGMKFDIAASLVEGFLDLGDARPFGILAAIAIVNSGNTSCLGDMGLYGGSSVDDGITVSGNLEVNSHTANLALLAAGALRIAADQLPCDMTWNTSLDANLAQRTYLPGVHCWTSPDIFLTGGDMYLDGDGDPDAYWVLRIDGDFTVGSDARPQAVHLVNGGSACNVFWVIGGGVMVHSGGHVSGTMITNNSITLSQSSSVLGGIISLNGEVNLYDAIIDNGLCSWNTRDDHNITFAIYAAEMIPLPLTENSTILTWTDLTAGFEIVSQGGSLSSILMISPELTELQLTWVQSATGVQVWYIPPYTTAPMVIDCELGDDNHLRALSNRGQGTYFFVVIDVTEWTVPDASNSSSSTGGGGGGDGSSGSDGDSSSSGSEGSSDSDGSEPPSSSSDGDSSSSGTVDPPSSSDDNSTDSSSSSSGTEGSSSSGSEGSSSGSEGSSGSSGDSSSSGSGGDGSDSSSGSEGSSSGSDGSSSGSEGSSSGADGSSSGSEGSSSGSDGSDSSSAGSGGSSSGTPGSASSGGGEGSSGSEGGSSSSGSDGGSEGSSGSDTSSGSGGGSDDSSSDGSSSGSDGGSDSSSSGSDDSSSGMDDSSSSSGSDYNSTSSLSGDDDSNSTSSSTGIRFSSTGRRNGTHNGAYATKGSTATTTAHILVTVSAIFATLRVLQ